MGVNLHDEMIELRRSLLGMGALVEQRVSRVVDALVEGDLEAAEMVRAGDDEVDRLEVALESQCMRLIALAHPVAGDLRFVLSVIRISSELERIGDLARGIAKRIIKLSQMEPVDVSAPLVDLAFASRTMLSDVLAALSNEDAALCRQVRRSDKRVDDIHKSVLLWGREEIPRHPEQSRAMIEILTMAQRFERIADITTNIAEDVIFVLEGRLVRHEAD
jgi:phosphate transport system protein